MTPSYSEDHTVNIDTQ